MASNEDFDLAEQLLKRATELDPADGEAWAASAILSGAFFVARNDTEQYAAATRSQAARAIKLAPNSDLARFAYAFSLRFDPKTQDECLRLMREEVARQPGNRMVVRLLGRALAGFGQLEQALVYFDKAAAIPGRDPVTLYNRAQALSRLGRYPETEAAVDEALALAPAYSNAHAMKISLLMDYYGDMAKARQHLEKVPPDFYSRDAGVVTAAITWLYSREPLKCLEALRPARDYLRFSSFIGPKAYLAGLAQTILGNADAARTEWRTALRVVDKLLETQPNSVALLENRALLLAALGQKDEAEPLLRELIQRATNSNNAKFTVARVQALLGRADEAITTLESISGRGTQNHLRYHPEWDSLRDNPRFQALLKAREQKK
ncbi:MAG: tetratricopeptide repeat protein [Opitutus sp.]|nr:tetratricopeptide repeat protein [Opitutus sp.]